MEIYGAVPKYKQVVKRNSGVVMSYKLLPVPVIDHPARLLDSSITQAEKYRAHLPPCSLSEQEMLDDLLLVIRHIRQFSKSADTMKSYRTETNRFLNWSWLKAGKRITEMKREDVIEYLEFAIYPDPDWCSNQTASTHIIDPNGLRIINPLWKPFKLDPGAIYSQASINAVFIRLSSLYETLIAEEVVDQNPVQAIRQKSKFTNKSVKRHDQFVLTDTEIQFCIDVCEQASYEADEKQASGEGSYRDVLYAERDLFTFSLMLGCYLRVSEFVANDISAPLHSDFHKDNDGNWWLRVTGKGNQERLITVSDDVLNALMRYRDALGLPPLPSSGEKTPLIPNLRDAEVSGDSVSLKSLVTVSDVSTVQRYMKSVFSRARQLMASQGRFEDAYQLLTASCHYLRHTGISNDVQHRPIEHVRDDAGHNSSETTWSYVQAVDKERAASKRNRQN